jgi:hypothetical protein
MALLFDIPSFNIAHRVCDSPTHGVNGPYQYLAEKIFVPPFLFFALSISQTVKQSHMSSLLG